MKEPAMFNLVCRRRFCLTASSIHGSSGGASGALPNELHRKAVLPVVTPAHLPQFLLQFSDSGKALDFFEHWSSALSRDKSHQLGLVAYQSAAFEALFKLANREQPCPHNRVKKLLQRSREMGIHLTAISSSIVIRSFGHAGLVSDALHVFLHDIDASSRNVSLYNNMLEVLFSSSNSEDHKYAIDLVSEMLELYEATCRPNHVTLSILLSAFSQTRASIIVDLLLDIAKKYSLFPSHLQLTQFIKGLCENHNSIKAWHTVHALKEMGCVISLSTFNALLTGLGREANFPRMHSLFSEMKEMGANPNVVTYGILINHLCKFGRVGEALHLINSLISESSEGCKPDIVIFNTVIDGLCRSGQPEEGLAFLNRMESKGTCCPNAATYNCLIVGFFRAGNIDSCLELHNQMVERGILPNEVTLNTIVGGFCKHGKIGKALDFFDMVQTNKGTKGNAITYTTLIGALLKVNNVDKAMHLFSKMIGSGLTPDSITYFTLIAGLSKAGKLEAACSVFSSMEKDGFCADLLTYNILLNGLCKRKKFDRAYQVLQDMEMKGIKADQVTFNTLISAFSKDGKFSAAQEIMKQMIDQGHVPTEITYGSLIHGFCKAKKFDDAIKLFRAMKVAPNTVMYNILINNACKEEKVECALDLMDEMQTRKVVPNVTTYNSLFKGLYARNMLDEAYKLMDQMSERGCAPDYITMETLTEWLSAVGEKAKLRMFVKGTRISSSETNSSCRTCHTTNLSEDAARLSVVFVQYFCWSYSMTDQVSELNKICVLIKERKKKAMFLQCGTLEKNVIIIDNIPSDQLLPISSRQTNQYQPVVIKFPNSNCVSQLLNIHSFMLLFFFPVGSIASGKLKFSLLTLWSPHYAHICWAFVLDEVKNISSSMKLCRCHTSNNVEPLYYSFFPPFR